jgi:hypothetical protein
MLIKDTTLNTFLYDVKGYLPEHFEDVFTLQYNLGRFLKYTKTIEERTIKPMHPKQVEQFKSLALRHGYAFLA